MHRDDVEHRRAAPRTRQFVETAFVKCDVAQSRLARLLAGMGDVGWIEVDRVEFRFRVDGGEHEPGLAAPAAELAIPEMTIQRRRLEALHDRGKRHARRRLSGVEAIGILDVRYIANSPSGHSRSQLEVRRQAAVAAVGDIDG